VTTPAEGLARLRAAAASGELDTFCIAHSVRVLTVFGSAGRGEPAARDLDVAVISEPGALFDLVALINDLVDLTGARSAPSCGASVSCSISSRRSAPSTPAAWTRSRSRRSRSNAF
jgi:predicted nucleotidyltransferase